MSYITLLEVISFIVNTIKKQKKNVALNGIE